MRLKKQTFSALFLLWLSDDRSFWSDHAPAVKSQSYYAAKYYDDQWLYHSSLDYTVLRPARLLNTAATGKAKIAQHITETPSTITITRADVAEVIAEIIEKDKLHRKDFDLANGAVPIAQAGEQFE